MWSKEKADSGWTGLTVLEGHTHWVRGVAFNPDGTLLASASVDSAVRIWDPVFGRCTKTLKGHTDAVMAVAFSPHHKLLASAGWDNTIRLWDPASGV